MSTFLAQLFSSKVVLSIVLACVIAEIIKFVNDVIINKQPLNWHQFVKTGGMPSQHTAAVTSLVVALGMTEGATTAFVMSLVFAGIVIRDALGVRRTAGEEGAVVNQLIKKTKLKVPQLRVANGHTPAQVLVGAVIGILSAIAVIRFF